MNDQPAYKRRLGIHRGKPLEAAAADPIVFDGMAYVGKLNWEGLLKTEYLFEPLATWNYVTTAAIRGQDLDLAGDPPNLPVAAAELEANVLAWSGNESGVYEYGKEIPPSP